MPLDFNEVVVRLVKYLVEGLIVSIVAFAIPSKKLNFEEILIVGLSAAASFSILDLFAPSIGAASRTGAGFAIGSGLTGGIKMGK